MRRGITVRQYLGLRRIEWRVVAKWCLVLLVLETCSDIVKHILGRPVASDFALGVLATAYCIPLLLLGFIVVGPIAEEVFFRGFLFEGIRHSRMGPAAAIVITSLVWSAMHTQYDLYNMVTVFLIGLLLGYARLKCRSIYASLAMHMFLNGVSIATLELLIYFKVILDPS